jgi:hypothetical protein
LIANPGILFSQKTDQKNSDFYYEVSPVYGFRKGIVSLTFDDGTINQFGIALPILKKINIPATFYLITNNLDTTTKRIINKHITDYFEIGSHTIHHPNLTKISRQEVLLELLDSKRYLKEYYGPEAGVTMAYPWGQYNNDVIQIAKKYYLAARSANLGFNSVTSPERFALKMKCFDKNTDTARANSWVRYAEKKHLWLIEMYHGIDNNGYSPVPSSTFLNHLKFLKKNEDDIWYSTVNNVIKYIDESSHAYLTYDNFNDSIIVFRVEDNLNNYFYNQAISIKLKVPLTWDSIHISNNGIIRTEIANENKFVLFNAVPDNRQLILKPGIILQQKPEPGIKNVSVYENLSYNNIKISLEVDDRTKVDISVIDMTGRVLYNKKKNDANGVIDLNIDLPGLKKGIYFIIISDYKSKPIVRKFCKAT